MSTKIAVRHACELVRAGAVGAVLLAGCGDESPSLSVPFTPRDNGVNGSTGGAGPETASAGCNQVELRFSARTPTVVVLVDRSSSMFEQGAWEPLKSGVLGAMDRLTGEVRFGFASYTGQSGGSCPDLTQIDDAARGDVRAIRTAYEALSAPSYKGETPTAPALRQVAEALAADPTPGPKFVLLVTDGEPDFCDDGNVVCARDAVVAAAQDAHARGVGTLVFRVGAQVDRRHLEDVARAGRGELVEDREGAVAQQCSQPRARYATSGGAGVLFDPDVRDQDALDAALSQAVASLRSCTFDLRDDLQIDPGLADQGTVEIDGTRVPFDAVNGYVLDGPSRLELRGAACEALRKQSAERVRIDFPCDAVVVI
ncbi:MAG: vWA domain-containing protein [Polyangiales bacterium]